MMSNFLRILISGTIATIIQKLSGLSPVSLVGFILFLVVFTLVSFGYNYFFPQKELSKLEQELIENKISKRRKKIGKFFKIVLITVLGYASINGAINYISFKYDLFDSGFHFTDNNSSSATIITTNKAIKKFSHGKLYYSIHKYKNKYYILQSNKYAKNNKKYLTLNSRAYYYIFGDVIENMPNCENITNNLHGVVYKEVNQMQMIFIPLWFKNNNIRKVLQDDFIDDIKIQCQKKIDKIKKQKLLKEYNKIKVSDLSKLSTYELAVLFEKLFKFNGFELDTNYAIKVFKEFDNRKDIEKRKIRNIDVYGYMYRLKANIKIYNNKNKVNEILKKYKIQVMYNFNYPNINQPLDVPIQDYSYIRIIDIKNYSRVILYANNISVKRKYNMYSGIVPKLDINIDIANNNIVINRSFDKPYILKINKEDIHKVHKLLTEMIEDLSFEENQFYSKNKSVNFNYTSSNILAIYDNDKQQLIYEYKNKKWKIKQKNIDEKYTGYEYIQKYYGGYSVNIYDDLKIKTPIKYMYFNHRKNKLYDSKKLNNFDIKDLIKLSTNDKDIVFVYELKDKQIYEKYSNMPRYTNIKLKNNNPYVFRAMSLISTKIKDNKYYIYLTKQDVFRGSVSNQIYFMKGTYLK